jgi:hypothetical protein
MEHMTKKTEIQNNKSESHTAQRYAGLIFGVAEAILAFRLIFKLLGANPKNGFVHGIYAVTQYFVGIFTSIFPGFATSSAKTTVVFEPATLIAMVVIALIAWVVLKLMTPRINNRVETTGYMEHDNQKK